MSGKKRAHQQQWPGALSETSQKGSPGNCMGKGERGMQYPEPLPAAFPGEAECSGVAQWFESGSPGSSTHPPTRPPSC